MTVFEHPEVLWLAVLWTLGWWRFARLQQRAVEWLHAYVSPRFRRALTVHGRATLRAHLLLLLAAGLLLIYAAAGPKRLDEVTAQGEYGRILLVFDASHSMTSNDLHLAAGYGPAAASAEASAEGGEGDEGEEGDETGGDEAPTWDRFDLARYLGQRLTADLEHHRFGLITYSGTPTINLPITDDRPTLAEALRTVEWYSPYQNSGSDLAAALDAILPFAATADRDAPLSGEAASQALDGGDLQVVFLGDGELPFDQDYSDALDAVAERGIPVHTVAIGCADEATSHWIYDYRDVVAGKAEEDRRVLVEYTSRREDEHFQRIARETGGVFLQTNGGDHGGEDPDALVRELAAEIRDRSGQRRIAADTPAARAAADDVGTWPLLLVLTAFLLDTLVIGHLGARPQPRFDLDRLGPTPGPRPDRAGTPQGTAAGVAGVAGKRSSVTRSKAGLLLLLLLLGCNSDAWRAYIENERGISRDNASEHSAATAHYQRSLAYQIEPEVPTHNLGRSATLDGRYGEAHDFYQQALRLSPRLAEAHYNDGIALYRWGLAERDPYGCELSRTLDLWQQAQRRFASAGALEREAPTLAADAGRNARFLAEQIAILQAWIETPPEHCPPPPPDSNGGGGGGGGDEPPPGGDSQDPPPQTPPGSPPPPPGTPPAGGGPLSEQELDQIRQALDRIAAQAREEGTFHRRSRSEQFSRGQWQNPDAQIWW